ncbi:sensor histidine kinase [Vibrio algivorus]|uniref:histidine kinase n=2 Tax=Vibrio algivorus TaxID=1667024 RepID=A0ABQ6ENI3_9VIBR|nr:sensor histidine kinase [Vibrio algivorus]
MKRFMTQLTQTRWWSLHLLLITFGVSIFSVARAESSQPPFQPRSQTQSIQVAVLATRGNPQTIQRWQPTIDWLNQQLPQYQFYLRPRNLEQMEEVIKNNSAEFVLTNPGQSVKLGWQYPLSWIATLKSPWPNGTNQALGSALVVRNNSSFIDLEDLQNSHAVAVSPDAFGGFLTLSRYLKSQQQDPSRFFKKIDYLGFPIDAMLYHLRDHQSDVAITPACLLENMDKEGLIDKSQFRVINNSAPQDFPCAVSTPLYPNWSFAKTSKANEVVATATAQALLNLPKDSLAAVAAKSQGWSSPISSLSVVKMYRDLNIHPQQTPWWQQALIWLKQHQQWAWGAAILFIALNIYHFWLEFRFNRNQKLLNKAQLDLKQKSQMLEHAQRVAIVGGLGTNLAHEINQPLSAIRNYSQGAKLRIEKGADAASLAPIMDKIEQQIVRVDAIVQRLRTLITKRTLAKQNLNINALIDDTLALLDHDLADKNIQIKVLSNGHPREIYADAVGLQQVFVNIINNATDSCLNYPQEPSNLIQIVTHYTDHQLDIYLRDNGAGLAHPISELQSAFVSTKEKGLGLGLSICHDIIEHHHGHFTLSPIEPHGCEAHIQLPYLPLSANQQNS